MKILSLPQIHCADIDMEMICCPQGDSCGENVCTIIRGCDTLFEITHIDKYLFVGGFQVSPQTPLNNNHVHASIEDFYRHLPTLHQVCLSPNITVEDIIDTTPTDNKAALPTISSSSQHHGGLTLLHTMVMNPYTTINMIDVEHGQFCSLVMRLYAMDKLRSGPKS